MRLSLFSFDFRSLPKILSLALSTTLVISETAPTFAWDDDRNSFASNRPQNFQNQYKPERNFSLSSQMDHQLKIQNTALQMRFGQRSIDTKTSSLTLTPSNRPTLPQPKLQFGTASPKGFESVKTEIPKPLAVSRVEPKGFLGAMGNAFKPIVNAVKATFQTIGHAIGQVVKFFSVDKAKITYQVQRDRVLKDNPTIREVSPGTFQVPPGQKAEHGGRTWEPGTTFQMNPNGGGIHLKEGVTMSPDMGGIQRADGNLLPVKMIGENGGAKPVGIDFTQIDPKTKFNFTQSVTMDGVGGIPAGTSMTYEGTKPGTESSLPTVALSFQNSRIENPQKAFESLGNGKEPITLTRAEMTLKGAIYQVNSLYLNKANETFYGSEKGEVFSLTQLESKTSAVQSKSTDLTQQSKKLSDDAVGAVNLSNHHMADLHKVTGTPATINFQTKEPLKNQGETTKTLQTQTQALAQHMDQGDYGKVANAVTDIETTQKALTGQIKTQQTQVETFQTYKRAVKGLQKSYTAMAAQADPESMKGLAVTQEQMNDAAPYFQEQKNDIRIQATNAVKALNSMEKEGIITPAEKTLKIAEIKVIRDHLLAAKPDNVGNAVIKTASVLEQNYQSVSKDFDEAIFDHLDNASEKYPKTMGAVGQSALAVAGGAAIVGLGYGLVTAPATTAVVVGSGAISQKTFEAMGLSPEAAAYYTAIVVAPIGAVAEQSGTLKNANRSILEKAIDLGGRVADWFRPGQPVARSLGAAARAELADPANAKYDLIHPNESAVKLTPAPVTHSKNNGTGDFASAPGSPPADSIIRDIESPKRVQSRGRTTNELPLARPQAQNNLESKVPSVSSTKAIAPYWPLNDGFLREPVIKSLSVGERIDRWGSPEGRFVSPEGTPFELRGIPSGDRMTKPYFVYEVVKPFEVRSGIVKPAFGQIGQGVQYGLPKKVRELIDLEYLREAKK